MEKMEDELKEILVEDILIVFDTITYGSFLAKL